MSAPRTNIEKQERKHVVPLLGLVLASVFGVGVILYWVFQSVADAPSPSDRVEEGQEITPPEVKTEPQQAEPGAVAPVSGQ